MTTQFNFKSKIKDVQNRIIASTIKEASNLDLLRSEEAIKDVIKSYTDRFKAVEGMLTDVSKYVVESKDIVRLSSINNLFESLYIDLAALYSDLEIVDNVLSLNLSRNKNYFSVIKKRVRDLWQRLELTRLQVYDLAPADESFYESFYSAINSTFTSNVEVDKKNGFLILESKRRTLLNDHPYIKSVTSVTYPVENESGGVLFTTSPLNDLNENYKNGTRDILSDGLWKEEILCKDVPSMCIDIGLVDADNNPIRRNYNGVVSIVDIEYAFPIELNRIDIDVFGEKATDIDCVLYKLSESDNWSVAKFELEDLLNSYDPTDDNTNGVVNGRAFDIISFVNIVKTKLKFLRLVFNQKNYSLLDSDTLPELSIEEQIDKDFQERRYELVKFNSSLENRLVTPVNDNNRSLYAQISSALESTRSIQEILDKINRILIPDLKVISTSFSKTAKFEIGAWSIEPIIEEYTKLVGKYDSKTYKLRDKSLISAQIKSSQEVPEASTCNWYITVNGMDIPVLENDSPWHKEPANFINISEYNQSYSSWEGSFILLDFPIDPGKVDQIGIFENGIFSPSLSAKIVFLNSRLLYLHGLRDPSRADYVIRYAVAKYNCVNLYALNPKTSVDQYSSFIMGIVSSRRDILEQFIDTAKFTANNQKLNTTYTVSSACATMEEAQLWFGSNFSSAVFVSDSIMSELSLSDVGVLSSLINHGPSKLAATAEDSILYYNGLGSGPSDLSLLGLYASIAPITTRRII